ncbi:hypothetical protein [Bacillus sp. 1P06AnD]|uniref:hypothetical protein n=1 Tax=Bacillus sp. 1P06AnD TaxID=3132208 RepID=UPI0039A294B2
MDFILQPSLSLLIAALLLAGFILAMAKKKTAWTILISRVFLLVGCLVFANEFAEHDFKSSITESGAVFFELGMVTILISSMYLASKKRKHHYHS